MKVLVTGGTGFLGRHVVWRLAAAGADVVFTGRRAGAAETVCALAPATVRWTFVDHGSKDAAETLTRCAAGADAIVHCAAFAAPSGAAETFRRANVASTSEVLQACRDARVTRLVHVSTPSVYFDYRDRLKISESEPLPRPVNDYARTKAAAEELVRQSDGSEAVILRPRALFGPWDATLFPRLLRVIRRGAIPLMRGGRAMLDLTYVDNAVDGIWLALTRPLPRRIATYNLSNDEPIELSALLVKISQHFSVRLRTVRLPWGFVAGVASLMEACGSALGKEPPLTRYGAGVLAFSQTLDLRAIKRDLGFRARVSLDEGLSRYAAWLAAAGTP
ncbi:MAG TPA: NAD(P)-dependent oxidoreductase [Candidatus Acidoferrales bacterium]|jgi:nucleoside-diphosphate-sugar epimerase|nr:NAD(P)-dependent oxidoreductase [Candidatus Acidoferrales bacterium]